MKIDNLILWLSAIKKTSEKMGTSVDVYVADEKTAAKGMGFKLTGVREEICSSMFKSDENDISSHSVVLTFQVKSNFNPKNRISS